MRGGRSGSSKENRFWAYQRKWQEQRSINSPARISSTYGFPVNSVQLEVLTEDRQATRILGKDIQLVRDARLGISEYAPGSQVIANGRVWESYGIGQYRSTSCRRGIIANVTAAMCKSRWLVSFDAACPVCSHRYSRRKSAPLSSRKALSHPVRTERQRPHSSLTAPPTREAPLERRTDRRYGSPANVLTKLGLAGRKAGTDVCGQ
jgi:hypothetical protein